MPVNVQHDCFRAECTPSSSIFEVQERERTQRQTVRIAHTDEDHFILNTLALHNTHILARLLPRELTRPSPFVADRVQHHRTIAQRLQELALEKQELNKAKRQLTKNARSGTSAAGHKRPYRDLIESNGPEE
jgi:hypothetical protein